MALFGAIKFYFDYLIVELLVDLLAHQREFVFLRVSSYLFIYKLLTVSLRGKLFQWILIVIVVIQIRNRLNYLSLHDD